MAQKYGNKKTRTLKDTSAPATVNLPRKHRKFLLALLEAAICEGVPFYVNKVYKDGKLGFKLFTDREVLESYLSPDDDPAVDCYAMAETAFNSKLADEVRAQGAWLEAQERLREAQTAGPVPGDKITRSAP